MPLIAMVPGLAPSGTWRSRLLIAAVAVGFARFVGVLWPTISEQNYLLSPFHLTRGYAVSLSTAQLVGVLRVGGVDVATVNMGTWALNTWTEFGFVYTAANGVLNVFQGTVGGGAAAYRLATSPAALPTGAMGPNLAVGPGASGAAQTLQIDYVGYGKARQ